MSDADDDLRHQLQSAMEKLDPDTLAIVLLHYEQGYTGVAIAKMLGQSRSAVAMTLKRTREQLRKRMGISGETR